MIVFLNGEWLEARQARIPIDDRGFVYGDGLFETARLHQDGYFRLAAHLDRLAAGAALLEIPLPPGAELRAIALELARRNVGVTEAMLRITITRGPDRGRLRGPGAPMLLFTLRPLAPDWRTRAERGWSVITARTPHPPAAAMPGGLKTLARVHNVLARLEAEAAGVDDALLLSPEGLITEGPTWNVFWARGGRLFTPDRAAGILEGVTRAVILELCARLGLPVEQGRWRRAELDGASEIFATMSSLGPVPVRALDGRRLPSHTSVLDTLRRAYWDCVAREARNGQSGAARDAHGEADSAVPG